MFCKQLYRLLPAATLICLVFAQVHAASPDTGMPLPLNQNEPESVSRDVEHAFAVFSKKWLQTQAAHALAGPDNPEITRTAKGVTARVVDIDTANTTLTVEPTGIAETPYLGTLAYMLRVSTSQGNNRETALAGPFVPSELLKITEIFLYRDGLWGGK